MKPKQDSLFPNGSLPKVIPVEGAKKGAGGGYQAASVTHQDLATWRPMNSSAQGALSRDRDFVAARIHDIALNDGWASASMDRLVDNIVGAGWRLASKPNARSLGIDPEEADELADSIEAEWSDYATDPDKFCDVGRRMTVNEQIALACRHRCLDGESIAVLKWLPRGGPYATAVQIIDPDRLSQPRGQMETDRLRAGVEMDENGAPIAYHIRTTHPGDFAMRVADYFRWQRIPRETEWGRPIIVHSFDAARGRAGLVRGTAPMAPILKKLKQITRYDEAELQAAVLNAVMAAFVESPFDQEQLADSLAQGGGFDAYQKARLDYYGEAPLRVPGAQVGFLFPGEKVTLTNPAHPNAAYEPFERTALRNVASALNLSYEQLSMDWSQVNYSSARAALIEIWRGLSARKASFAAGHMQPIYSAWLEEAIETGRVKLPAGAPPFLAKKAAYCNAEWIGPGRGWVDPQKEADAAVIRMDGGFSTLEKECAEQGQDWKSTIMQQGREYRFAKKQGLNVDKPIRGRGVSSQQDSTQN